MNRGMKEGENKEKGKGADYNGVKDLNGMIPLQRHYIFMVEIIGNNIVFSTMLVIHTFFPIVSNIVYHSCHKYIGLLDTSTTKSACARLLPMNRVLWLFIDIIND